MKKEEYSLEEILNAYLSVNPAMLNETEKQVLLSDFKAFRRRELDIPSELIYDFFAYGGLLPSRHELFADFITGKHLPKDFKRVLDVGAGKHCPLSEILATRGYLVKSIDPEILLNDNSAVQKGFIIEKGLFLCDEFAPDGIGTNISDFDLIVAMQPCQATEHIIRQCTKYNKPFVIKLCADSHPCLSGEENATFKQWFSHLESIGETVINNELVIATNKNFQPEHTEETKDFNG